MHAPPATLRSSAAANAANPAVPVLQNLMRFDEDVARQYIAEVVLALEYVHSKVRGGAGAPG